MSNIYTERNEDNLEKAVAGLDQFTKNWCMNCKETELQNDLVFRCDVCNFEQENGDCMIKKFVKHKLGEVPYDFGAMGRPSESEVEE